MIDTHEVALGEHIVHFYERDEELVHTVGNYLGEGLRSGGAAIVIATEAHGVGLEAALRAAGIDVADAISSRRLIVLDARETLSTFMTPDGPDADAFYEVVGRLVREAAGSGRPIRAFGEMVALLWDEGDVPSAIHLEMLWNDLGLRAPFSLFCAYPRHSVEEPGRRPALDHVCRLHSAVLSADDAQVERARMFARGPHAPRAARYFVAETLQQWGRADLVDNAALIVSELATNAVIHAQSDFSVVLHASGGGVRIEVCDGSSVAPILRDLTSVVAPSGRGVALVAKLATRWGSESTYEGKTVWADLR